MLSFHPISASALADDGDRGLAAFDIVTGPVVITGVTMFEDETFSANDITLGAPSIETAAIGQEHNFGADDITTTPVYDFTLLFQQTLTIPDQVSTPVVDTADLTFFYDFAATEITLGASSVDSIDPEQFHNFNADDIAASPIVDTLPFFQTHILAGDEITAGVPTLPVRFLWDFQEIEAKTWTEVSDITDIWTDVPDPSDTWSDAA